MFSCPLQAESLLRQLGKQWQAEENEDAYHMNNINEFWLYRIHSVKITLNRLKILHFTLCYKFQALNMHWSKWVIVCELMEPFQDSSCRDVIVPEPSCSPAGFRNACVVLMLSMDWNLKDFVNSVNPNPQHTWRKLRK